MIRAKGLSCREEHPVEDYVTTAAERIVRIICPITREKELATLLEDPETGAEIDLVAEAERIFGDDGISAQIRGDGPVRHEIVRVTAPDPPTLDELGLAPPTEEAVDHVQAAYSEWIGTEDGRAVAKAIRDRALELRRRGWSSYGIQAIAEVVRFDHALRVGPDAAGYRVNNSHLSRLSRDLMAHYPELAEFFETRELTAGRP